MFFIILLGFLSILFYIWSQKIKSVKSENGIPGPRPLPLIGNLLHFVGKPGMTIYEIFHELHSTYGPIVSFRIGAWKQIVIQDYDLVKEVLSSDAWTNRYEQQWQRDVRAFGKNLGMMLSNGDVNKKMRRFTIRALKEFGFGKKDSLEQVISTQFNQVTTKLDLMIGTNGNGGTCVQLKRFFTIPVLNILWTMVAGFPFSNDNEQVREALLNQEKDMRQESFGNIKSPGVLFTAFPLLGKIMPSYGTLSSPAILQRMFQNILDERRREGTYKEEIRDYIDLFLREIDAHKDDPVESQIYTDEQFAVNTMDLFVAGSESISNTMEFTVFHLMKDAEIQRKIHAEIDAVVGSDRLPTAADRPNMPYTEAVYLEVQRMGTIVPFNPRMSTKETKVGPYSIPKDTSITCNILGMHMSEKLWGDPQCFRPERFLDENMSVVNADKVLPFGTGGRVCIGEGMARFTIFLLVTTFMQKYSLKVSPTHGIMATDRDHALDGLSRAPKPFHAFITLRAN